MRVLKLISTRLFEAFEYISKKYTMNASINDSSMNRAKL
jgi:hypothetical protein